MEKIFEIASKVSTPLALAGIVIVALFFVYREIIKKNIFPTLTKNLSSEIIKLLIKCLFVLGLISLILGFASYTVNLFSSSLHIPPVYQVHVLITDSDNRPVEDADIISVPDGEHKKTNSGWQIDIPQTAVPKDKKLNIWAAKDGGIFKGSAEYILANDYNPHVTVKLHHDVSARIKGQVNDEDGYHLAGASVYIEGHATEKVTTSDDGLFDLPAHTAPYEPVHLFVEKMGYKPWNDVIPAGGSSLATIILMKK
jgi:hypothetical protein